MLGMRIAILRASQGMSQAKLAHKIGVSTSAVGMYEQGRREPSLALVVRLAQTFGVTTDYLLTGQMSLCRSPETRQAENLLQLMAHSAAE